MNNLEAHIKTVTDKLQQLIKKNASLQREKEVLTGEVNDLKTREEHYKASIFSLNQQINILKAASGNIAEADQRGFEKMIDQYIKEIDRCIGILSE